MNLHSFDLNSPALRRKNDRTSDNRRTGWPFHPVRPDERPRGRLKKRHTGGTPGVPKAVPRLGCPVFLDLLPPRTTVSALPGVLPAPLRERPSLLQGALPQSASFWTYGDEARDHQAPGDDRLIYNHQSLKR